MKIKDGFTLRSLYGEHIVLGEGLAQVKFNKMVSLNDSAAYLWEQVAGREFTAEDLAALLTAKYDVPADQALKDAQQLVASWLKIGLIE